MAFDPLTIAMLVLLALLIFFMFRNSRKRQKDLATLQSKIVPGVDVMTNFGVYGKVLSIDSSDDEALIETTPGTILRVHRQTIARVIEPTQDAKEETPAVTAQPDAGEPEYGERLPEAQRPETQTDANTGSQNAKSGSDQ